VMPALSAVLLTFSFQFSLLSFHVGSKAAAVVYVVYPISDIGHCRKCGKYVHCTQRTAQEKRTELILTVTRLEVCIVLNEHNTVFARSGLYIIGAICNRCFPGPTSPQRKRHLDYFKAH